MKFQRPNIKINKTWLMLIVAIVLSLLTAWLTLQYLKFKEESIEAEIAAKAERDRGTTVAVVVPIRPLPPGTLLDESVVASRNAPADFIYEDTITVEQFDAVKGSALLRPVEKGKPLRRTDVREVFADFSGTLKDGKRAMTINVDEINSVSHMVEPGNLVDLMLVMSSDSSSASAGAGIGTQTVVPFLDQIKVLATGQKITQDAPNESGAPRKVSYSTITLEVSPAQAARLALAGELGKIRAVLRNQKDKEEVDFDAVNAANFLEDIRERAKRSALKKPRGGPSGYVEYIIGGKGNSDAVAPAVNVPLPPGLSFTPAGVTAAPADPAAMAAPVTAGMPANMNQLIQLGLGGNNAKPSN